MLNIYFFHMDNFKPPPCNRPRILWSFSLSLWVCVVVVKIWRNSKVSFLSLCLFFLLSKPLFLLLIVSMWLIEVSLCLFFYYFYFSPPVSDSGHELREIHGSCWQKIESTGAHKHMVLVFEYLFSLFFCQQTSLICLG